MGLAYLILLFVFFCFRAYILFKYGDFIELNNYKLDVLEAFYVGAKFDTAVIAYAFLPLLLVSIIIAITSKSTNEKAKKVFNKFTRIYFIFIALVLFTTALFDTFFYDYFTTHFNTLIFGLKEDKTSAVLISMWTDYPVIRIVISLVILFFVFKYLINKILKLEFKQINFGKLNSLVLILVLGIYFIGIRGSLGMFPLKLDHTTVSSNAFVNELVLNGPFALKLAVRLKNEFHEVHIDSEKSLKEYSFKSESQALSIYLDSTVNDSASFKNLLTKRTKENTFLTENPPNVVFVLIESLSNHYLDLHSEKLNLLGSLEEELKHCYTFRNFLSATGGTIHTLESMLVQTAITPISQSAYANTQFTSSVALPFKSNNYQTNYLTGDQLGWRNSGKFVKSQGFDKVEGFSKLNEVFKNPESFSWGVHDEYLYQYMYKKLEKSAKPQFFFTLTISNHTPYDLPAHFEHTNSLEISAEIMKELKPNLEIVKKNFTSYYYAANELGKFINKIRNSALGENTIVVATGDHNERGVLKYGTANKQLAYSVPLIMYIPEKYKPNFVNLERYGSHKDVFPTIYNLALSNQNYFNGGNDLFTTNSSHFYGVFDKRVSIDSTGFFVNGKVESFYKWKGNNRKELEMTSLKESPKLKNLKSKLNAHSAITTLSIQKDIKEKKNDKGN